MIIDTIKEFSFTPSTTFSLENLPLQHAYDELAHIRPTYRECPFPFLHITTKVMTTREDCF